HQLLRQLPCSTIFPYTTLFRSVFSVDQQVILLFQQCGLFLQHPIILLFSGFQLGPKLGLKITSPRRLRRSSSSPGNRRIPSDPWPPPCPRRRTSPRPGPRGLRNRSEERRVGEERGAGSRSEERMRMTITSHEIQLPSWRT